MALDIKLHPKQYMALTSPANEILYGGAVGGGKALALDTPILTIDGWKTMGSIVVGDKVFDENGIPCNVVAKSEIDYTSDTYEVVFDRKKKIICDGRHQWNTVKRSERHGKPLHKRKSSVKTTVEIKETLLADEGRANHSIPIARPLQFPEKKQPIHPYIFGMWLAGGYLIDEKKQIIKQQARAAGTPFQISEYENGKYTDIETFNKAIEATGVKADNKYIPDMYLFGSEEQRLNLLQGFVDILGTVNNKSVVALHFTTFEFAEQMCFIINSLGMKSNVIGEGHKIPGGVNKRGISYSHRLLFRANPNVVTAKRRAKKFEKYYPEARVKHQNFYIKKVNKIEPQAKQCIQVDSPSHLYLAGKEMIPTHNSFLMRVAAILWAMEAPGLQVYLFRLTRKELEDNHMIGPGGFHELLGDAVDAKFVKINNADYQIQFKNGPHGTYLGGSIIHLCHCQYEKDKYKYQGAEMAVLMIDEATHFTKTKYEFLRSRVRIPKSWKPPKAFTEKWGENFFPRILLGTNPGGISHNFYRKEFVKLTKPMEIVQMPKSKGGMRRQFIPAVLDDNPSIDKDEYEGKVMAIGNAAMAKMMLEGDWDAVAGGMFDDVWDPKVHMIEPFQIPSTWYVDRAFDWGSAAPFSVGWYAESDGSEIELADGTKYTYPQGTLFRIYEWYGWNGEENEGSGLTGYEIGQGIKDIEETQWVFEQVRRVHPGPADTQIWNANPKYDSAYNSIAQEINAGYYGNDSYKIFDIFTPSDKSQGSNVRGWDLVRTHLKNSLNYPKVDRKCIFFFNTCVHVARTLPIIMRDENRVEEIAKGQEDHIVDEIKYRLAHTKQPTRKIHTRIG